jgi:hypothetical protein
MRNVDSILKLIENDIISSKLVNTFNDIGIDANLYQTDVADIVFDLLEIKEKNRTDSLYRKYYSLINQGKEIDFVAQKEQITEQAKDIQTYLSQFKNP